jgi:hypothetical protein
LRRAGAEAGVGARKGEARVLRQGAAAPGPHQLGEEFRRAQSDAPPRPRRVGEAQQIDDLFSARRHQPVEAFRPGIGARDAGAQGRAIIEAARQNGGALDERAAQPGRQRPVIGGLLDQPLGDQHLLRADALFAGALRHLAQNVARNQILADERDFRRQRRLRPGGGCTFPVAAV